MSTVISLDTSIYKVGPASLKAVSTTFAPQIYYTVTGLTVGKSYTASAWARQDPADGANRQFQISRDSGADAGPFVALYNSKGSWYETSTTFTATATSHQIWVWGSDSASYTLWFDAITLTEAGSYVWTNASGNVLGSRPATATTVGGTKTLELINGLGGIQTTEATSITSYSIPTDVIAGDLLLLAVARRYTGTVTYSAEPAGFTFISSQVAGDKGLVSLWYKIADGTEGGTTRTASWVGQTATTAVISGAIIRGNNRFNIWDVTFNGSAATDVSTSAAVTALTMTTVTSNTLLVTVLGFAENVSGGAGGLTITNPTDGRSIYTNNSSSSSIAIDTISALLTYTQVTPGAVGSYTVDFSRTGDVAGITVAIRPGSEIETYAAGDTTVIQFGDANVVTPGRTITATGTGTHLANAGAVTVNSTELAAGNSTKPSGATAVNPNITETATAVNNSIAAAGAVTVNSTETANAGALTKPANAGAVTINSTETAAGTSTKPANAGLTTVTTTPTASGTTTHSANAGATSVSTTPAAGANVWRTMYLKPDALLVQTGLTGAVANIQDSPTAPDGSALTPSGGAINLRMSFENPGEQLRQQAGDQIIRVRVTAVT